MLVPIVTFLGSLATTANVFLLPKKNTSITGNPKLTYKFSPNHIAIQQRIDRILGTGFYFAVNAVSGFGLNHTTNKGIDGTTFYSSVNVGYKEDFITWLINQGYPNLGWSNSEKERQFDGWVANGKVTLSGGWCNVSWIHAKNPDELAQLLFKTSTDGQNFSPAITAQDNYKSYSYPSPSVPNGAKNFNYFIRCAPQELTCMLFGKTINPKDIVLFLGSGAATLITGGAATPLLIAATSKLYSDFTGKTVDSTTATQQANDLVNIFNKAEVFVTNGTKDDLLKTATDFVINNPSLFSSI